MSRKRNPLPGLNGTKFSTVLADPPWRFQNRTGKVAPGAQAAYVDTKRWTLA